MTGRDSGAKCVNTTEADAHHLVTRVVCGSPVRCFQPVPKARTVRRLRGQIPYTESDVATGTVKWFNPTKGYGFIQPKDGGKDVFVHISAVERAGLNTLNEGQQIDYELVANRGKQSAENLKVH